MTVGSWCFPGLSSLKYCPPSQCVSADACQEDLGLASRVDVLLLSLLYSASVQMSGWVGLLQRR